LCLFFLALRPLHSFPTRRSSDLAASLLRPRGPNCIFKVQFRSSYAIRWGVTGNAPHRKGRWLRIPVIVGRCGQLPVVLGSAPAMDLAAVSFADLFDESAQTGYQRRCDERHAQEFREYIEGPAATTIPLTFNLR